MFWFVCFLLLRSGTKMEWMICPGFCHLCVRLHHQQLASRLCPPPNCQSCLADRSPSLPSLTKVSQLCPLPNWQSCLADLSPSPPLLTKVKSGVSPTKLPVMPHQSQSLCFLFSSSDFFSICSCRYIYLINYCGFFPPLK